MGNDPLTSGNDFPLRATPFLPFTRVAPKIHHITLLSVWNEDCSLDGFLRLSI